MARIDLHVHSRYSEHPSEWVLQRIGTKESYTDIDYIYDTAKSKGMDFVTVTDHNSMEGAIILKEKHPDDVITGIETTTYFNDGCKIHILMYGIDEQQFKTIQLVRDDIFELRDLIKVQNIAYSVAHATFSINNMLTSGHLEKLILLFDVFEGINGARTSYFNNNWMEMLKKLTPDRIQMLYERHRIEPISMDPWIKAFTGGSDDHAGLFIGQTCTISDASGCRDLLSNIRNKNIQTEGRHNNYKTFAFTLYKIAYDFLSNRGQTNPDSPLSLAIRIFAMPGLKPSFNPGGDIGTASADMSSNMLGTLLKSAADAIRSVDMQNAESGLEDVFNRLGNLSDAFFSGILDSIFRDIRNNDLSSLLMDLLSMMPAVFFTVPFISSLHILHNNSRLLNDISKSLDIPYVDKDRKILWFTDTLTDLNGVAETVKDFGWHAANEGLPLKIVTSGQDMALDKSLPPNIVFLPESFSARLPLYEENTLSFPSLLKSIEMINNEHPSEILISTPGPVGVFGLMMARLLNIKCTGYYHTDFTSQLELINPDRNLAEIVERGSRWFYSMMDEILSPSNEYLKLLEKRGFDINKCRFIQKGIDVSLFKPKAVSRNPLVRKRVSRKGITLLYAGRISKDKNVDLLVDIYKRLLDIRDDITLLVAGTGPYMTELTDQFSGYPGVRFYGRVPRNSLPGIYSSSDIFVFPSTTDTFGLVVAEAQACGLPAVVSDTGGPKEIIIDNVTGCIAKGLNPSDWTEKILWLTGMKEHSSTQFKKMKAAARKNICERFSTETAYNDLFGHVPKNILNSHEDSAGVIDGPITGHETKEPVSKTPRPERKDEAPAFPMTISKAGLRYITL